MRNSQYAHTLPGRPETDWHLLETHLRDTSKEAAAFASHFEAERWGALAGLWHDLGKYSEAFQSYLRRAGATDTDYHVVDCRGSVDHSTAGAQHAVRYGGTPRPLGHLLAYCIAGHHTGLPDNVSQASGLDKRLQKAFEPYLGVPDWILSEEIPPLPPWMGRVPPRDRGFALAFFTRMIFSSLVDADFLDTEAFIDPSKSSQRRTVAPLLVEMRDQLTLHLAEKSAAAPDTPVNRIRAAILAECRNAAELSPGFFAIEVPTGGGKTLSSLAFALEHAVRYGLGRVVYAIPFTSIIEQTADVFRKAFGEFGTHVLEHHGNVDVDDPDRQTARLRLASENYDAEVIVTTNVQLFESLFAARTSRCRKLHRLAKSVIILDEAQALPPSLLKPTLATLRELASNYGSTIVVCTATQPAIVKRPSFPIGIDAVRPIVANPSLLHESLRRVEVEHLGLIPNEDLIARLQAAPRVLCVVNSRRHALDLFNGLNEAGTFHLSASMCARHRSEVVARIKRRLAESLDKPCRCISTQVIEAGVDVDFPVVLRASAGLDSIAQAAGRCNREGVLRGEGGLPVPGRVYVFDYDRKKYPTSRLIETAADRFAEILPDHRSDLLAPVAIEAFFGLHYWMIGGDGGKGWDKGKDGKSVMECFDCVPKTVLHALFREAADRYRLIDDAQVQVLVPHGKLGRRLISILRNLPDDPEPGLLRRFDRKAQRYTVGVYDRPFKNLLERGLVAERLGRWYLVADAAYSERIGLNPEAVGADPSQFVL